METIIESIKIGILLWYTLLIYLPVNLLTWGKWSWFEMKYSQLELWAGVV